MKHLYLIALFLWSLSVNGQVNAYMDDFRLSGHSDFETEQELLAQSESLLPQLLPYLQDSLSQVRQKAYYLIYRKGLQLPSAARDPFVMTLLQGCNDADGSVVGQNIIWLQGFDKSDFSPPAHDLLETLIRKPRLPHRQHLLMLAGYVEAGKELMNRYLLQSDLVARDRWYMNLALARMGNSNSVAFCLQTFEQMTLSNEFVEYAVPEMIYTRHKTIVDLCVTYLNSNEPLCSSADPDNEGAMLCGYRILELVAPVIKDFPLRVSALGTLVTNDYEAALSAARIWFERHPDYVVNNERF